MDIKGTKLKIKRNKYLYQPFLVLRRTLEIEGAITMEVYCMHKRASKRHCSESLQYTYASTKIAMAVGAHCTPLPISRKYKQGNTYLWIWA